MTKDIAIKLFEQQKVRTHWDDEQEKWFFSVQDVVQILSESKDVKQYIKKMRSRDTELNSNWGTICTPLQMLAADGKMRKIQASDTEGLFRIIQSIPSPKAEPFKQWLAKVGLEANKDIARKGGTAAKKARLEIEKQTGKSIISDKNAKHLLDDSDSKRIDNNKG